jgi:hypothetical protein
MTSKSVAYGKGITTIPRIALEKELTRDGVDRATYWVESGLSSFKPGAAALPRVLTWARNRAEGRLFSDPQLALDLLTYDIEAVIIKCIIPRGAYYYEGEHFCMSDSHLGDEQGYCSSSLRMIEEIKI